MKARSKFAQFLPYIVCAGLAILLTDIYLKLQTISTPTLDAAATTTTTTVSAKSVATPADPPQQQPPNPADQTPANNPPTTRLDDPHPPSAQPCQEYILYYKPPKTGSTALTDAARWYVATMGHSDYRCGLYSCGTYAEGVCTGKLEKRQLLGHLNTTFDTVHCLKKDYYVVTSNRDPMDRWMSAYRYNIQHKATHYGIPWQVNFTEWMSRVPECVLLNYYDGRGRKCGDDADTDDRIAKIVSMVDEVVDLYNADHKGPFHKTILPFLGESNVSDTGNRTVRYPKLPKHIDARLNSERKLYNALKERSKMPPPPGRNLCVRDLSKVEENVEG